MGACNQQRERLKFSRSRCWLRGRGSGPATAYSPGCAGPPQSSCTAAPRLSESASQPEAGRQGAFARALRPGWALAGTRLGPDWALAQPWLGPDWALAGPWLGLGWALPGAWLGPGWALTGPWLGPGWALAAALAAWLALAASSRFTK